MCKNSSSISSIILFLLLVILCCANLMDCGKVWHFKIAGTVECYDLDKSTKSPSPDAKIELREKDSTLNADDLLGSTKTDGKGEFVVIGEENEPSDWVEPYLYVLACGTEAQICLYSEIETQQNVTILMSDKIKSKATTNGHDSNMPIQFGVPSPHTVFDWGVCKDNGFWKQ